MGRIADNIRFRRLESTMSVPDGDRDDVIVIHFSKNATDLDCENVVKILEEFGMGNKWLLGRERFLIIHTDNNTLLDLAQKAELKKETKTGTMQKFDRNYIDDFLLEGMTINDIVKSCEALSLIRDEIRPALEYYIKKSKITDIFPLHDVNILKSFSSKWNYVPVEGIRNYFNSSIALYFAFALFYSKALIFPVIFGFLHSILEFNASTVCSFYVVWPTIFLELWKRKCSGLAFKWGTIEMTSYDKPRENFRGTLQPDPITGVPTRQYPRSKTFMKMYIISYPIVSLCVVGAAYFFWFLIQCETEFYADYPFEKNSIISYLPTIVQSILIFIFTSAYDKLATFLTEYENHRTRAQHERHRIIKLILFELVNNFFSSFYYAFYLQDFVQLEYHLFIQFVTFQILSLVQEISLPFLDLLQAYKHQKSEKSSHLDLADIHDRQQYKQCTLESGLSHYISTYEDYLQMWIQFGYIVIFAAVAPNIAFLALIHNLFEMKVDTWKLSNIYKRPFGHRAKNIGAWQPAFELLSVIAILTNCSLVYLLPNANMSLLNYFPSVKLGKKILILEHILLGLKFLLHKTIHEQPGWVRIGILKGDYESSHPNRYSRKKKTT